MDTTLYDMIKARQARPNARALPSPFVFSGIADQWIGRVGCSEANVLLLALEGALRRADAAGVDKNKAAYVQAKAVYDAENSVTGRSVLVFGSACTTAVNALKGYISALERLIAEKGGEPAPVGANGQSVTDAIAPPKPVDYEGLIKLGLGVVALGGVIYLAGPFVRPILAKLGEKIGGKKS